MKTYDLTFKYDHRKWGPQYGTKRITATGLTVALSRGTKEWLNTLEPKERRDARKKLMVTCVCLGKPVDDGDE